MMQLFNVYYASVLYIRRNRFWIAFLSVSAGIVVGDTLAHIVLSYLTLPITDEALHDMSFAPEVWLGVVSMIIGTLVVIITIASQVVPRMIDVYMNDWRSLLYAWLLVLSALHAIVVVKFSQPRPSSSLYNTFVLLPMALLLAFPYIYYILAMTKPSTIIRKIYYENLNLLRSLSSPNLRRWLRLRENTARTQEELFRYLNQLDNILYFVSFKELQAQIVINVSAILREYLKVKPLFHPDFFKMSHQVATDISFQTLEVQFKEIEETQTFYELKCLRILGDAYNKFLYENAFDLASLCGSELNLIAETSMEYADDALMEYMLVRFNTMMRSAFKHGVSQQEARNLYNLAFHYSTYIKQLALNDRQEMVKKAMRYLKMYGSEIFRNSQTQQTLAFINDVFTFEMKEVLILISELGWERDLQRLLLCELLEMDDLIVKDPTSQESAFNSGVRTLQAGLALFYISQQDYELAAMVVDDIADDIHGIDPMKAAGMVDVICKRIESAEPTFWEDTDRGNNNIYFTPYKAQIGELQFMLLEKIEI
ncbi:MAG: hypothetical protein MUF71_04575 [Candidatus Kapabacteria bacterium]|jgi:uncharacterized membrane protein YhaH (DUF805 family)|nr:hypothetical protein [Candidatus Kapabacteria bacterium]